MAHPLALIRFCSPLQTVYPLMGIAANVALVLSGSWIKWVNSHLVPLAGGTTQASAIVQHMCTACWGLRSGMLTNRLGLALDPISCRSATDRHGRHCWPRGAYLASPVAPACPCWVQAMLNYLVGSIVCLTGVMLAAKWALDK